MTGTVTHAGDAIVQIAVRATGGQPTEFAAVVDTGFNDYLTLPAADVRSLGLSAREEGRYELADGSLVTTRLFEAEVQWFGQWRRVLVGRK